MMTRLLTIIFLLGCLGAAVFAQDARARLIDEFPTRSSNCEEGFARLDSFFVELSNDPTASGVIVLYEDADDSRAASLRELQLQNHFTLRRFPRDRVTFIRGIPRTKAATQFWLVPAGANPPEIEHAELTVKPRPTQPYLYAEDNPEGVAGCFGHMYDLGEYANELKSVPNSRGRIVIRESSPAKFRAKFAAITVALAASGIPRSRFTAIYKYVRPNRLLEVTELWVIP